MSDGIHLYGLRDASRLIRETRGRMKGVKDDYARGWRAALEQVDILIDIKIADIKAKQRAEHTANKG